MMKYTQKTASPTPQATCKMTKFSYMKLTYFGASLVDVNIELDHKHN